MDTCLEDALYASDSSTDPCFIHECSRFMTDLENACACGKLECLGSTTTVAPKGSPWRYIVEPPAATHEADIQRCRHQVLRREQMANRKLDNYSHESCMQCKAAAPGKYIAVCDTCGYCLCYKCRNTKLTKSLEGCVVCNNRVFLVRQEQEASRKRKREEKIAQVCACPGSMCICLRVCMCACVCMCVKVFMCVYVN